MDEIAGNGLEVLMETILAYLLSVSDFIGQVITWAIANPWAASIWGPLLLALANYVVKLTPWHGDDDLLAILKDAIVGAYRRKVEKR
jgi:hypothetical protein